MKMALAEEIVRITKASTEVAAGKERVRVSTTVAITSPSQTAMYSFIVAIISP
jgi:hypothetical protein